MNLRSFFTGNSSRFQIAINRKSGDLGTDLNFRYFANTKNSFADEFVRLVRNRLCPDSTQLTQNFKNMSLDQSLVGECCFIAIRDSKKDKTQILNKIRYGVSKYFRKEVHRAKPNVLKWNCDEQNQITNRSQLYWWVEWNIVYNNILNLYYIDYSRPISAIEFEIHPMA